MISDFSQFVKLLQSGGGWAVAVCLAWWIYRKDKENLLREKEYMMTYIQLLQESISLFKTLSLTMDELKVVIEKCKGNKNNAAFEVVSINDTH